MFCSLNLKVVELWSLPELDLVRLVFSCYFVLVLLLLVQAEGFPGSGLWEWQMSVGLRWSCSLLLDLQVSARCSSTGAFLWWSPASSGFGSHSTELCGYLLRGVLPVRAGECPPRVSAWGSPFAFPVSFSVDLGFWRSFDAGRVPGVGAFSTRLELRQRFSWCWFFLFVFVHSWIFVHNLPFRSCFKPGFFLT
jgi:hypothetical protein